ncbi:hypothetical protein THRCLA_10589 [Thraustotheca clavata]|uniref:Uncharacterized protein n=1 Tax=Thraustotheca clavata TaxID=74557 RepID=A0A1V9YJU5_9STRA|nr:hypothetical protein THRCLA_10589 [Thraustotheca clavata]
MTHCLVLDQYRQLLPKCFRRTNGKAMTLRQELIDKLIAPAVATSRNRVLHKQTKACVVDYLAQQTLLTDGDITIELFQALIISCVNVWVNQPGMSDKLASVCDPPDSFVNQFIDEVERVYAAGPSHEYAPAVKNTTFQTPKGPFTQVNWL